MFGELARDSKRYGETRANENLESMVTPTEFPIANPISQTDTEVQRNLLREYEQKFAELPEQQKLTKLCSNAGFSKNIENRCRGRDPQVGGPDDRSTAEPGSGSSHSAFSICPLHSRRLGMHRTHVARPDRAEPTGPRGVHRRHQCI